jgi:hypothetical protein
MKKVKYLLSLLFTTQFLIAQSIDIGTGASIDVGVGADICAETYGNINGTLTGGGTQCGQFPLPVELTTFTATAKENVVNLYWKTETEVNNYGFEIERGQTSNVKSQITWKKIGFVEGHGNSNSPKEYSFTDNKPFGGSKFQYRLKQIDIDGQFEYSDIVGVVVIPEKFALYQNYPNPFNPTTKIRYQIPLLGGDERGGLVTLKVYDVLGNEVATLVNEEKPAGTYEITWYAANLPSGVYFYTINAGSFVETKKMILLR